MLHKSRRCLKVVAYLAVMAITAFGSGVAEDRADATIHVIPSELFRGDLKRLEPHLGLMTGCVRVERRGGPIEPFSLGIIVETWIKGKTEGPFQLSWFNLPADFEISISFREENDREGRPRGRLVIADSADDGATTWVDVPEKKAGEGGDLASATRGLPETAKLTEKALPIWLLTKGNVNDALRHKTMEESAKHAEWALIIKLIRQEQKAENDPDIRAVPAASAKPRQENKADATSKAAP